MNKRERHALYKRALKKMDTEGLEYGLCRLMFVQGVDTICTSLPELLAQRPKNAPLSGYWWPLTDQGNAARRRALIRCIELSAPKPRKKP